MINLKTKYFCLFCLCFIFSVTNACLYGQITGGGYSASYLFREQGTRPIALAGAFTSIANDPNTIYYNPAGLSHCAPVPMISLSYSLLEFKRSFANLAYAQSFDNFGIGAAISSFKTGSFTGRNRLGFETGNYTDYFLNFSAGASYSTNLASFGIIAKYINNSLEGTGISGNGFGIDFGAKFNVLDLFNFGIAVQNIGGFIKYNTRAESGKIPFVLRSGIATEIPLSQPRTITFRNEIGLLDSIFQPPPEYILISFDANFTQYQKHPNFVIAMEVSPHELFTFRSGFTIAGNKDEKFKLFPMTIWGVGLSIKPNLEYLYNLFTIDFSFGNDYISKHNLFFSLGIVFQF